MPRLSHESVLPVTETCNTSLFPTSHSVKASAQMRALGLRCEPSFLRRAFAASQDIPFLNGIRLQTLP